MKKQSSEEFWWSTAAALAKARSARAFARAIRERGEAEPSAVERFRAERAVAEPAETEPAKAKRKRAERKARRRDRAVRAEAALVQAERAEAERKIAKRGQVLRAQAKWYVADQAEEKRVEAIRAKAERDAADQAEADRAEAIRAEADKSAAQLGELLDLAREGRPVHQPRYSRNHDTWDNPAALRSVLGADSIVELESEPAELHVPFQSLRQISPGDVLERQYEVRVWGRPIERTNQWRAQSRIERAYQRIATQRPPSAKAIHKWREVRGMLKHSYDPLLTMAGQTAPWAA